MKLLDGKKLSKRILSQAKKEIKDLKEKPVLAAVLVGENKASETYIRQKKRACEEAGMNFRLWCFLKNIKQEDLENEIEKICSDDKTTAVIIQLPLPGSLSEQKILNKVPVEKDVDMLSEAGMGCLFSGKTKTLPPVVCAVASLLKAAGFSLNKKQLAVVGAGKLVGMPIAVWASKMGAIVNIINSKTKNPEFYMKTADVVVSGVGKPGLITGKKLKKGVVVIDAGTAFRKGKTIGDVDFESVRKVASAMSPVPGGVGPMTVACLIANVAKMAK